MINISKKIICLLLSLICVIGCFSGCNRYNKWFSIKEVNIELEVIPYSAFESEAFYEDYLKPIMLKAGFKEKNCFFEETEIIKKYVGYKDKSLMQTEYTSCGRFEIPNSSYVLGFEYKIVRLSASNDYEKETLIPDLGAFPFSYYCLDINLNKKTDTYEGNGTGGGYGSVVFSGCDIIKFFESRSTFSGYDPTAHIFSEEHTTTEIYEFIKNYFDDSDIKEKLFIEQQIK